MVQGHLAFILQMGKEKRLFLAEEVCPFLGSEVTQDVMY